MAGRRFGKTVLAIAWLIARVLERGPGSTGYYVLPFRIQAKDVAWRVLLAATRTFRTGKNESELAVILPGDRRIVLKGADDPERLEGVGIVAAVLDEFAKMKLSAWEHSLRPALSDHGGRVLFIGKPRGHNHLKRFFDRGRGGEKEPNWRSWIYRTADGGFVTAEDIAEAKRDLPARIYRQEYEASFEQLVGRIYEEFDKRPLIADANGDWMSGHVVPAEDVPAQFEVIGIGVDWGFTHPGVAVVIGEASGGRLYAMAEEWHEEFSVSQWKTCIAKLRAQFPKAMWFADPSRPDLIAEFSLDPAINDVNDGILEVMKALHPQPKRGPTMVISDACTHVIAGLDAYVWQTNAHGESLEKPLKKDDDAPDALRYGVMGLRRRYHVGDVDDGFMDDN